MVPSDSVLFVSPFRSADAFFTFGVLGLQRGGWSVGKISHNVQRQVNLVDNLMLQRGSHALKFGVDYRRLSPEFNPACYALTAIFGTVNDVIAGTPLFVDVQSNRQGSVLFRNLGVFAQDTWLSNLRSSLKLRSRSRRHLHHVSPQTCRFRQRVRKWPT